MQIHLTGGGKKDRAHTVPYQKTAGIFPQETVCKQPSGAGNRVWHCPHGAGFTGTQDMRVSRRGFHQGFREQLRPGSV